MGDIKINNVKVLKTIVKAVKKDQTGLRRLFINNVTEEKTKMVKKLRFKKMNMVDLDFLRYLPNLEELMLSRVTGIKDVSGLEYCRNLKEIMIYDTYIEDFQSLEHCSELEYFDYLIDRKEASHCIREDFRFLRNLPKLYQIDLSGNMVEDISFLSGHPALEQLVLDQNPIRTIAPLKTLKNLKWLEINECGLSQLEDIEQFPALTYLNAVGNNFEHDKIKRYKEILKLEDGIEL